MHNARNRFALAGAADEVWLHFGPREALAVDEVRVFVRIGADLTEDAFLGSEVLQGETQRPLHLPSLFRGPFPCREQKGYLVRQAFEQFGVKPAERDLVLLGVQPRHQPHCHTGDD